jgi:serine protease Do
MPPTNSTRQLRGVLTPRRLVLLATVASLGTAALFAGLDGSPKAGVPVFSVARAAESSQHPAGFADIVEKVKPSVISVRVKIDGAAPTMGRSDGENGPGLAPESPAERFFRRFGWPDGMSPQEPRRHNFSLGQGSGFFVSADGYAITNNHVVAQAESVEVTTDDGKAYTAKVIGTDPKTDLALIKIDGRNDFPFVKLADNAPRIGDWVLAVGNPFGLGGTVTAGIISARGRDIGAGPYDEFIQIDAPVNKGNSGGPSFDVDGNVIGVNTAIFSPSGGSVGIAFAVPADTVKTVVAQLKDKGAVTRGWLGVQIQPVTADIAESLGLKAAEGALVAEPQPGSPAAKAGILSGDVIMSVDGEAVKDARELAKRIGAMAPQSTVKLGVLRKGEEKTFAVTLGALPHERQARVGSEEHDKTAAAPRLGLTLAPAAQVAGAGEGGVIVTDVSPDGPAVEHGFKTGDVILEVGGKSVSTPADVRKALADARSANKRTVLMRVKSEDTTRFVALPIGRA